MAREFRVERQNGCTISFALIDLICSGYEPYAVLEENILTVILFSTIVQLEMDTGKIVQYVPCDNTGGLCEIHAIEGGYIIWGEEDIFRYDRSLNQVWHFMGRDILVSLKANRHFWIENGFIHCRDFLGWHYVLDLNGNTLSDFREFDDSNSP